MSGMPRSIVLSLVALVGAASMSAQVAERPAASRHPVQRLYVPARDTWETRKPADVGMDEALLAQAIEYAKTRDTTWGKDDYMADQVRTFGRPLGAVPPRHGPTNGVIVRHGYISRMGNWNGRQLVSASWIKQATAQGGPPNSNDYGYLWWLNAKGGNKGVPTTSFQAQGNGSNTIFIDPEHDLVIVWRWHAGGDFFARVVASVKP